MLVLECVPSILATEISQTLSIPVVGIGAGAGTDAQVLVFHDMLGLSAHSPRFVRNFLAECPDVQSALKSFNDSVIDGSFPADEHSFT